MLEKQLEGFDDGYKTKYVNLRGPLDDKVKEFQTKYAEEVKKNNAAQQALKAQQKESAEALKKLADAVKAGNDKAMEARLKKTEEMTQAVKQNEDLRKQMADTIATMEALSTEKAGLLASLNLLKKQTGVGGSGGGGGDVKTANRQSASPHALVLDISKGKPLWDAPRGKIIRVDEAGKKVFIDKGSRDGIKPGLTFTVFAAGWNGSPKAN